MNRIPSTANPRPGVGVNTGSGPSSLPRPTPGPDPSIANIPASDVFPEALVDRLGMKQTETVRDEGGPGRVSVRRLPDGDDPNSVVTLAAALGRPNDVVEIADAGPIHEDDFTIAGRSRIIRAKPGIRPIIKIEYARQQLVREQAAKFLLGGNGIERLTIEGLDLVVDLRDLPLSQSSLFQCEGVDLTLRDCTVTVEHAEDRRGGFTLFRLVEASRPNRIRLERTLVRGPIQSLADLEGRRSELILDRSVVQGSNQPLIHFKATAAEGHGIRLVRSILLSRAPIIRVAPRVARIKVRSLASIFARVEGAAAEPWLAGPGGGIEETSRFALDYDGEANQWFGWAGGTSPKGGVPGSSILDEIHRSAPAADHTSLERPQPWSPSLLEPRMTAAACGAEVPNWRTLLEQVAAPQPFLHELTVNLFPRPLVPEQASEAGGWAVNEVRPLVNLTFDPALPGPDNLGDYLSKQITDPRTRYQVQITTVGAWPMTPVRLPDGVALAILGPPGQTNQQPVPTFYASKPAEALIELHGGSLTIANIGLTNDGLARTRCGVWMEDGLLVLNRVLYRDLSSSAVPGDVAIRFQATTKEPTSPLAGGLVAATSLPTLSAANSWFWTNAGIIEAELGRGVLSLENCVLNSVTSAFNLRPSSPTPSSLDASLLLGSCTIVAERFAVIQESWSGRGGGGGRPWMIISRSCVFPRPWKDTATLLGVDPEGFATGSLFWQSSNDIYDVGRFIVGNRSNAAPATGADLKRQWVDLWGIDQTRGDRGPDVRRLDRLLSFQDKDRARTSRPSIAQLKLDPKIHKGQGTDFAKLPPTPR